MGCYESEDGLSKGHVEGDFEVEGTIYTFLMKCRVENIANCLASDDVADVDYHTTKT